MGTGGCSEEPPKESLVGPGLPQGRLHHSLPASPEPDAMWIVAATPKGGREAGWLAPGAQVTHHRSGSLTAGAWAGRPSPPLPQQWRDLGSPQPWPPASPGAEGGGPEHPGMLPTGPPCSKGCRLEACLSRPVDSSQKPRRRRRLTPTPACPSPQPTCPGLATPALSWQGPIYPGAWRSRSRSDRVLGGRAPGGGSGGRPAAPPALAAALQSRGWVPEVWQALLKLSPDKPDRLLLINPFSVNAR